MEKAVLYNKHVPIIRLMVQNGKILEIKEVIKGNEHFLPIILQGEGRLNLETINKWLSKRLMPDDREGIKSARMAFRGFETHRNMFSLSDQYWLRYKNSETWDKMNFFTNKYDQEQGKIFFEPWNTDEKRVTSYEGPDLTTNGVLKKRWIQDEDNLSYLIKAGSLKYHQEPLSEVLASIVLRKLNVIPFVEYEMVIYGLQFCSKCSNFITKNTEYVPATHILMKEPIEKNSNYYHHFLKMCEKYKISGARDFMDRMIAADHLLRNTDRHFGNFGFIRDADTGDILGFAPLFDFGRAYWGAEDAVKDKTSKFFSEAEMKSFYRILPEIDLDDFINPDDMVEMVEKYPEISEKQAETIIQRIQKTGKEIKHLKNKPDARQRGGR